MWKGTHKHHWQVKETFLALLTSKLIPNSIQFIYVVVPLLNIF